MMYECAFGHKLCLDAKMLRIDIRNNAVALEGIGLETFEE